MSSVLSGLDSVAAVRGALREAIQPLQTTMLAALHSKPSAQGNNVQLTPYENSTDQVLESIRFRQNRRRQ
jgi:hypothetical protein